LLIQPDNDKPNCAHFLGSLRRRKSLSPSTWGGQPATHAQIQGSVTAVPCSDRLKNLKEPPSAAVPSSILVPHDRAAMSPAASFTLSQGASIRKALLRPKQLNFSSVSFLQQSSNFLDQEARPPIYEFSAGSAVPASADTFLDHSCSR
jgi:hypothetical protein